MTPDLLVERAELWDEATGPLLILAESLNDLETVRIGVSHRLSAFAAGRAMSEDSELAFFGAWLEGLQGIEADLVKQLERAMKRHPLGGWVKATPGLGLKQTARLIAAVGNPFWNSLEGRARRGPAELWAYTGFHVLPADGQKSTDAHRTDVVGGDLLHLSDQSPSDAHASTVVGVAPRRVRGQRANWSAQARTRAFLVATSCVKATTSPYRAVYVNGRAKYADAVHAASCAQCGICQTCGKPPGLGKQDHAASGCDRRVVKHAEPGQPLRDGHKHARALRLVAKAVLRDMWVQSRDWHHAETAPAEQAAA